MIYIKANSQFRRQTANSGSQLAANYNHWRGWLPAVYQQFNKSFEISRITGLAGEVGFAI